MAADSSLNQFDRELTDSVIFQIAPNSNAPIDIKFQFPPKIISDSNSSIWISMDVLDIEPVKIHKGSEGRKIGMKWEYVATDSYWDGAQISQTLRNLKSYFVEFSAPLQWYPVVKVKYTNVIPEQMNFRLMRVNIAHGPELTDFSNAGGVKSYFPIYTEVTVELELVTAGRVNNTKLIKVDPLVNIQTSWY